MPTQTHFQLPHIILSHYKSSKRYRHPTYTGLLEINMAGTRCFSSVFAHLRRLTPRGEQFVDILSRGCMYGAAFVIPKLQHTGVGRLDSCATLAISGVSTIVYVILNWKAVYSYVHLAAAIIAIPLVLIASPLSRVSFHDILDRLPLVLALTSFLIDQLAKFHGKSEFPDRRHSPRGTPGSLTPHSVSLRSVNPGGMNSHPAPGSSLSPESLDRLFSFTQPYGQSHPPSQRSSDLSLHSDDRKSFPSSWDSQTRGFWPNGLSHQSPLENDDRETIPRRHTV
ncbi:hypothetical protein F5Y15DRAFT_385913 [Xylariaceae sp. FL0016]|nr:hypothetical protein F5Y15DRAFT_385913 [Xylariaceae sp. FL0016]